MPKRIVISKLGGPEVLTYEDYEFLLSLGQTMFVLNRALLV